MYCVIHFSSDKLIFIKKSSRKPSSFYQLCYGNSFHIFKHIRYCIFCNIHLNMTISMSNRYHIIIYNNNTIII